MLPQSPDKKGIRWKDGTDESLDSIGEIGELPSKGKLQGKATHTDTDKQPSNHQDKNSHYRLRSKSLLPDGPSEEKKEEFISALAHTNSSKQSHHQDDISSNRSSQDDVDSSDEEYLPQSFVWCPMKDAPSDDEHEWQDLDDDDSVSSVDGSGSHSKDVSSPPQISSSVLIAQKPW